MTKHHHYSEVIALKVQEILNYLGEDVDREGLRDTPRRVAKFYQEFLDPGSMGDLTAFSYEAYDQMIIVGGIEGWSLCEHHLLPFKFVAHVGYIPLLKVLGLSKIPRIVDMRAHRLQLQERLTDEIANEVEECTNAQGVIVVVDGWHTCVAMRGITKDVTMTTCALRGLFGDDLGARNEFFQHLRRERSYK